MIYDISYYIYSIQKLFIFFIVKIIINILYIMKNY